MNKDFIWWKHGIIYQIYPRSFFDSNGDGTGDIPGITAKLDYLQNLGVDGLWLSPFFKSPMDDFGYDISDYCAIDPVFGTLKEFDFFIDEAHKRNIHIILDLVMNHTSNQHDWFSESQKSKNSPKRDWYIWHKGRKILGKTFPPNNWRAAFGGGAWKWDSLSKEYYLHLFLEQQPDLNWRNPDVEKAMFDQARFWLERGVDGFRLDVINYIVKDLDFRSNPYSLHKAFPRRHDQQNHLYDRNRPETHDILKRFRELMDGYGETMLVGEIYPNEGRSEPEISSSYQGTGNNELHLSFDFSPFFSQFSAKNFKSILSGWYSAIPEKGWPCHVLNNHDKFRSMTRLCKGSDQKAMVLAAMLLTQKGTPFLYYGEELGMSNGKIRKSELQDPLGIKYWPIPSGRDPERTPMQWNSSSFAGFTEGSETWLPINSDYKKKNVQVQNDDKDSLLNWYKDLIVLRKTYKSLSHGDISFIDSHKDILAYRRFDKQGNITILLNFSSRVRPVPNNIMGKIVLSGNSKLVENKYELNNSFLESYEIRILDEDS